MSLSEANQILTVLERIDAILNNVTVKSDKVIESTPKLQEHEISLRKEIRTLSIRMMTMQRFSGRDTLDGVINKAQEVMAIVMRLRMLMLAVEVASGPWGWAYAAANAVAVGISVSNLGQ